jgi:S-adenosylmethionine:tRNA ribosyltransferase-isomerase
MNNPPADKHCISSAATGIDSASGSDIEAFSYDLPAELIAQEPLPVRHSSRLLCLAKQTGEISHTTFADLPQLLNEGDLLVVNDTAVIPARLRARRAFGGLIEILLLRPESNSPNLWRAMAQPLRKLKPGEELTLEGVSGSAARSIRVVDIVFSPEGHKRLLIDLGEPGAVHSLLAEAGFAPLPPYIQRSGQLDMRAADLNRYQTVFASAPGAVAAPTAGLHFSQDILGQLLAKGIETCTVTLHVGPGTFKPITSSVAEHTVESELYSVPEKTARLVNQALDQGRRVIAVGTTSCRALESAGLSGRLEQVGWAETSLYIKPGYKFQIIKGLITNFHLSGSSLLVLVATFAGHAHVMRAYKEAVEQRYRFYSYGDAMLVT